jgi:hypothetical protein
MFNTIKNFSRKADKYGDVHFISFLSATMARLAYFDDNKFLNNYSAIMGPVIQPKILQGINSVDANDLSSLLDDQRIFGLNKDTNDIFAEHEYEYKGKNFIDFISLNMPQNINIINGELGGKNLFPIPGEKTSPDDVKYISIGWSNYGEVYVVADKRMPNTILLLFRGTYSAKTASLYTKPTSIVPLTACKDSKGVSESFLYGIFKPSSEMIHTIIEAMRYLAIDFLGATKPNSVKIITTGHSLGGAMCTNFAYLWMGVKKTAPYNTAPYNVLSDNIVCVSLGAPRCMGSSVAKKFCNFVAQKKILYLRITTRGDPVPAVPPKTGFQHPCSDDSKMRMEISEDCNPTLRARPKPNISYDSNLDCQNYKTRAYIPNPLSHCNYLDVLFLNAVDIVKFFKGIGIAQEVSRGPGGSTVCRLIMGQTNNYKVIFFDVNKAREKPTSTDAIEEAKISELKATNDWLENKDDSEVHTGGFFSSFKPKMPSFGFKKSTSSNSSNSSTSSKKSMFKIGGEVAEDRRMTKQAFDSLIQQMVPLEGKLCPQKGQMANPFNNSIMPDLSCPGSKFGGKNRRTKKLRKYNNGYKNKNNRNKSSKNKRY